MPLPGAAAVAQLLHAGVKLVKLQLSKNSIGDQGALVLATVGGLLQS
jgi:hypothetical protein